MRLIDADALKANCDITIGDTTIGRRDYVMFHEIDNAPTIEAVPKDFHDKTCEAMAKRHTEEIQRLMPKQGEWKLFYESKDGDNVYKCSCCRFITVIPEGIKLFSFCPNCGADMRGADAFVKTHEVVANGNCALCGKPLSGDRVFVCEECNNNVSSESERSRR